MAASSSLNTKATKLCSMDKQRHFHDPVHNKLFSGAQAVYNLHCCVHSGCLTYLPQWPWKLLVFCKLWSFENLIRIYWTVDKSNNEMESPQEGFNKPVLRGNLIRVHRWLLCFLHRYCLVLKEIHCSIIGKMENKAEWTSILVGFNIRL